MEEEEIKERLSCYRPGKDDPNDPVFSGALKAIEGNPELEQWSIDHAAFDSAIRSKLAESPIPAGMLVDLKQREGEPAFDETEVEPGVEPGVEPIAAETACAESKTIRFPMWGRVAAVAAILVASLFGLGVFNHSANAEVENFRADMALLASKGITVDHKSDDIRELQSWVGEHAGTVIQKCPGCLEARKGVGCKVLKWGEGDHSVSLVCFERDTGKVVHLFVISREALGAKKGAEITDATVEGLETVGWIDAENVYILIGSADGIPVKDLL